MGSKQTFKGILQFRNQDALIEAMQLVDVEAPGSDMIDLQDSFYAEGLMLFNLDINAPAESWDENRDAFLILAENASRGFVVGVFNGGEPEFFNAGGDSNVEEPESGEPVSGDSDYFPFEEGTELVYDGKFGSKETKVKMIASKLNVHNTEFVILQDSEANLPGLNDYWDGTYFQKENGNIYYIHATHEAALKSLDFNETNYGRQMVYHNAAKEGTVFSNISTDNETFRIYTVEGYSTLEVPYGTLENCMVVKIDRYQINGEESSKSTMHQYFAPGIGLVKVQFEKGGIELSAVNS